MPQASISSRNLEPSTTTPGARYVFTKGSRGWHEEATLTGSDAGPSALFGYSVAISGATIVVGAPGAPSAPADGAGRAYVFTRDATGWHQVAELKGAAFPTALAFGTSVGVSGGAVVVGTQYLARGSYRAYIFQDTVSGWQEGALATGTTTGLGDDSTYDGSVAVSGSTVAVGAPEELDDTGRAYVLAERAGRWGTVARLVGSDTVKGDEFGSAVGVSGTTLVVAAGDADNMLGGAAYVFGLAAG